MSDLEIWRPIPSLPKRLASSWGRVMVIPYEGTMARGIKRVYGGAPTYGVWEPKQRRFILQIDGKTYKIARLICEAFHGPAPEEKPVCMHLDENSRNNRPENLRWGTQKENLNAPGFLAYCSRTSRARSEGRLGELGSAA